MYTAGIVGPLQRLPPLQLPRPCHGADVVDAAGACGEDAGDSNCSYTRVAPPHIGLASDGGIAGTDDVGGGRKNQSVA